MAWLQLQSPAAVIRSLSPAAVTATTAASLSMGLSFPPNMKPMDAAQPLMTLLCGNLSSS